MPIVSKFLIETARYHWANPIYLSLMIYYTLMDKSVDTAELFPLNEVFLPESSTCFSVDLAISHNSEHGPDKMIGTLSKLLFTLYY